MELIAKLIFAVVVGFALLIICGVGAAEAWAAWESRRYRRKREEDAEREIPEDPRERMVPKSWRADATTATMATAEQAPELNVSYFLKIRTVTPPRNICKILLSDDDFDIICNRQHILYPSKVLSYDGVRVERSAHIPPGQWCEVYEDGTFELKGERRI